MLFLCVFCLKRRCSGSEECIVEVFRLDSIQKNPFINMTFLCRWSADGQKTCSVCGVDRFCHSDYMMCDGSFSKFVRKYNNIRHLLAVYTDVVKNVKPQQNKSQLTHDSLVENICSVSEVSEEKRSRTV